MKTNLNSKPPSKRKSKPPQKFGTYEPQPVPLQVLHPSPSMEAEHPQTPVQTQTTTPTKGEHASAQAHGTASQQHQAEGVEPKVQEEKSKVEEATADTHSPRKENIGELLDRFIFGCAIDWTWVVEAQFVELKEVIEGQSWVNLFQSDLNCEMIPSLMKDFCFNFKHEEGIIRSVIRGIQIEITSDYLARLFQVPNVGFGEYMKNKPVSIEGVSKETVMKFLKGEPKKSTINNNTLKPFHRLLFNLVWRGIVPRTQHRNEASFLDCCLIYCLAKKIQINFPEIMMKYLIYNIPRGFKVGYGSLLTRIFKDKSIPFENEPTTIPTDRNIIGQAFLHGLKMKVHLGKVVNAKGSSKGKEKAEEEEDSEATEEDVPKPKTTPKKSKKRKASPLEPVRRSTRRKRGKKKPPVHITIDREEDPLEEKMKVPEPGSGTKGEGSSLSPMERLQGMLELVITQLHDIEGNQEQMMQKLDKLEERMNQIHKETLEKIDAITTEEIEVDAEKAP